MAPNVRPFLARLVRRLTNVDATDHATPEQQQGMRMLWLDGILASASTAFYAEFVVLYMLALGASATVIGLRASINGAAALAAPMIGAYLVARSGARKRWVLWGPGGVSRLALLAMAAVPLVFRGPAAVWGFVALLSLQAFASAVGMPAHHSLLGDVVPLPIRGRFMGAGMMFNSIAAVLVLPVAGFLVARIGGLSGYQVLWLLAALAGLGATAMYWRIPEPPSEEGAATQGGPLGGLREAWGSLRGNRPFLLFCGINFLWTVGINISGPFFTVHMVEGLGFSADTIAYLATFTTLFNVVALRLAGGLVDRHGAPKMTAIAMLLVPLMPLLWVFASTPVHIGIAKVYGFFAWAGFHVAALPMLLLLAPPRYRSQYMAVFNTVNGVAGVLAPLPASWLYANWGFTSNLLISAGGRMAAGLLFLWLWRRGVLLPGTAPEEETERELARA